MNTTPHNIVSISYKGNAWRVGLYIMPSISYLNKALQIICDKHSTKGAKLVARQLLHNSGFTDEDIYVCLKQGSIIRITIFEA